MTKFFTVAVLLIFMVSYNPKEKIVFYQEKVGYEIPPQIDDWEILIKALIQVESEGNQYAVGKTNDLGILQITPIYVEQVNNILKGEYYFLEDRTSINKSLEMFEIYQAHFNPDKDILKAIKIHNPGAGQWYTNKVMNEFNNLKKDYI